MLLELSQMFGFRTVWIKYALAGVAAFLPVVFTGLGVNAAWFLVIGFAFAFFSPSNRQDSFFIRLIFSGVAFLAYASLLSLLWLRTTGGHEPILYLVAVIAGTDIGGYFVGKTVGGPKMAPKISPNKTWSGLIGGAALAGVFGALISISPLSPFDTAESADQTGITVFAIVILSALFAPVAQLGDILESWLKRQREMKDSGNLIPGHGGLLDRVDGYLTAAPLAALMVLMHERGLVAWP